MLTPHFKISTQREVAKNILPHSWNSSYLMRSSKGKKKKSLLSLIGENCNH